MPVQPAHLSSGLDVITAKEIDDCNDSCAANQPDRPQAVDQDDIALICLPGATLDCADSTPSC